MAFTIRTQDGMRKRISDPNGGIFSVALHAADAGVPFTVAVNTSEPGMSDFEAVAPTANDPNPVVTALSGTNEFMLRARIRKLSADPASSVDTTGDLFLTVSCSPSGMGEANFLGVQLLILITETVTESAGGPPPAAPT